MGKGVFVTVGTTQFDSLIETVTQNKIIKILKQLGYTKLLLQIGRCEFEPEIKTDVKGFIIEYYKYKPTLEEDIEEASLVISHAGAGTCLEVLGAEKPLLVVINDELMGNHQIELAQQLKTDGHIEYCTCSTLEDTLKTCDLSKLKRFPPGQPEKFASFLDKVMGYS